MTVYVCEPASLSKTISQLYCKCHCNVFAVCAEAFPKYKSVVIVCFGLATKWIPNANIAVNDESFPCPLVTCASKKSTHIRLCAEIFVTLVVVEVRPHKFWFYVETIQRIVGMIYKYELVRIPYSKSFGVILEPVVAGTNYAYCQFACMYGSERAFVTYFCRTREPR